MDEHKHKLEFKEKAHRILTYYEGVGWDDVDIYVCIECKEEFLISGVEDHKIW